MRPTVDQVWAWLSEVPDPEIPVISLVELGVIRDVDYTGDTLVVTVTPTYSGCPATSVINFDIEARLRAGGVQDVRLERQLSPPWTTDWIATSAKEKLRAYGIAPPIDGTDAAQMRAQRLGAGDVQVPCPRCGSVRTERISQFGSTPCKAAYRCRDCLEPFDYFKCI